MSKMTNLKKGVVGVCAATMLAGMCAVPAFAADPPAIDAGTSKDIASGGTVETAVKAQAKTAQISATVPTTVTASVDSAGVLTFPDNKTFVIAATNDSWPIKVSNLDVAVAGDYNLVDTPAAAKDISLSIGDTALKVTGNDTAIESLKQASKGSDPIGITMSGILYQPSYADVTSGVPVATLTWTLSAY